MSGVCLSQIIEQSAVVVICVCDFSAKGENFNIANFDLHLSVDISSILKIHHLLSKLNSLFVLHKKYLCYFLISSSFPLSIHSCQEISIFVILRK
jgi:hypothetical protein